MPRRAGLLGQTTVSPAEECDVGNGGLGNVSVAIDKKGVIESRRPGLAGVLDLLACAAW